MKYLDGHQRAIHLHYVFHNRIGKSVVLEIKVKPGVSCVKVT